DPDNFALLRRNAEENGHSANVVLVGKAASDRPGQAQLHKSQDNQGDHRLYASQPGRAQVSVQMVRLDDFFHQDAPDTLRVIKMDIQGAEGLALLGMLGLLRRHPQAKVVCEFWPLGLHRAGTSASSFLEGLAGLGFRALYVIDERRRQLVRVGPEQLLAIPL